MTTTQKLLGGSLLFLGGIGLTLFFQTTVSPRTNPTCPANTDCLEVRVRLKNGGPDCEVNYEAVNVRTTAAATPQQPDQIYWCVRSGVGTQYFIHFTNNSGNNSPFTSNDFLVNKTNYGSVTCSDFSSAAPGKPTGPANPYTYEVHYNSAAGPVCSDPMVILK